MITTAGFKALFPEFKAISEDLIASRIQQAAQQMDPVVWGAKYDLGLSYLTAHLLATSPMGQQARLSSEKSRSTYTVEYEKLLVQVAGTVFRVV